MRANAETNQRNGVIYATLQDLLSYNQSVHIEQITMLSGYRTQDVEKALESLKKQGVIDVNAGRVTSIRAFKPC